MTNLDRSRLCFNVYEISEELLLAKADRAYTENEMYQDLGP